MWQLKAGGWLTLDNKSLHGHTYVCMYIRATCAHVTSQWFTAAANWGCSHGNSYIFDFVCAERNIAQHLGGIAV